MDLGLTGKVVWVGGGSRGLGYAVAEAVAAEGAKVSIMARDPAAVQVWRRTSKLARCGLNSQKPGSIDRLPPRSLPQIKSGLF